MGHRVGVGATSEHLVSGLQLEDEPLSRNGLHRDLGRASAEVSMEPDLDGRTVRGLQSRHEGLSETYREEFSDLGHLGLDHASPPQWIPIVQSNANLLLA